MNPAAFASLPSSACSQGAQALRRDGQAIAVSYDDLGRRRRSRLPHSPAA